MSIFNKNKKRKAKKVSFFGISFKSSLLLAFFVLLSFAVALVVSLVTLTLIAVNANVIGDRQLGRSFAITIDQDEAVKIFEEGSRIYYGLSEEEKADPTTATYLSRYTQLKDEEYLELQNVLIRLADTNSLKWIDLRIIDEENERFVYLLDTAPGVDLEYAMGSWQYMSDAVYTFMSNGVDDRDDEIEMGPDAITSIAGQNVSHLFCTLAPFYHPETGELIGYIGIGEENALISDDLYFFAAFYLLIATLFALVIVILARFFVKRFIVSPIRKLTNAARKYSEIDDKINSEPVFSNLKIRTHDEIRLLAESMADMELDLASYMENLTTLAATQERISAELSVAESIQSSMLPDSLEGYEGDADFKISSYMRPAREVGGDFYDYFVIDDDHIGLSIADVSGKGVPAALFMAICKTLLKNAAMEETSPADVVRKVNKRLCENNTELMFVTTWFGIYTVSTHTLVYVNAGHEYPAIYRAASDKCELIMEDHDLVLGFESDLSFTEHTVTLEEGDKLFLYTDGIPEATSTTDELYGTDRMVGSLNVIMSDGESGQTVFDELVSDIESFIKGADQFDDMTMLLIERTK